MISHEDDRFDHHSGSNRTTQTIVDIDELCRLLDLPASLAASGVRAAETYPLRIPRSLIDRIVKGDPDDPILRQFLPHPEETLDCDGFTADPLEEWHSPSNSRVDGSTDKRNYLKKYAGRALILPTAHCGGHCRFCFRRHSPRREEVRPDFEQMVDPVARDPSVREVILSGGDPLTLNDEDLKNLLYYIVKIPHVKRIRIHSRLPVLMPQRLTDSLATILSGPVPIYLVLHVNHPREIDENFLAKRNRLGPTVVLSQTVLLKGVNDSHSVLIDLMERLADARIVPYYLHQLDRVSGAAHFEVPEEQGKRLIEKLSMALPGYAVPKYVREIPGEKSKKLLF